jgi:hypothetical protein
LSLAGLRQLLLHFVMIKPTHYDDDGYPIQWFRSAIPSNTLACLNALAEDARGRNVRESSTATEMRKAFSPFRSIL